MFTACIFSLVMVTLRAAWQDVKNADIAGMSPEKKLNREKLHRELQTYWIRFNGSCCVQRVLGCPRSIYLMCQSGCKRRTSGD
jgi:hypothetical protein